MSLAMLAVVAALAQAAASVPDGPAITNPDWLHRPSGEDVYAVYPGEAMRMGRSGRATIVCKVMVTGRLNACEVAAEDPPGDGFGFAALALSAQFLMTPQTQDGKPVAGGTVRIPIVFKHWAKGETRREAPSSADEHMLVRDLAWTAAPTYAQVAAAYPKAARQGRLSGTVTLYCRLDGSGGLDNCRTILERPGGKGFGGAARDLVKLFRTPLTTDDGRSLRSARTQLAFSFTPEMLDVGQTVIGKPRWAMLPDPALVAAAYPVESKRAKIGGKAVLNCRVAMEGVLEDCRTVSEAPEAQGFADAARKLTGDMRVGLWTDEGLPTVGGRVNVPLRFEPED